VTHGPREGDSRLERAHCSYEMAAKLQLSAPEVLDIAGETDATRNLYGLDEKLTADMAALPYSPGVCSSGVCVSSRSERS